jgi:2-C-methyl-D-erythritol 4-phosphate cytidylyltransferase
MKRTVIIVAGGTGTRMGTELPKQFLPLAGKPILMHTIEAFYNYDAGMEIIVVLPVDQKKYWDDLVAAKNFRIPHIVVDGGETRFHSVRNGLEHATGELIAVHDGVRPFVSKSVIVNCFEQAVMHNAVIPVIDVVESVRKVNNGNSQMVNRDEYKLVQTPQVFHANLLKYAYMQNYVPTFTDDASVVESFGISIFLVAGNRENIKITTTFDLKIGEALLSCLT